MGAPRQPDPGPIEGEAMKGGQNQAAAAAARPEYEVEGGDPEEEELGDQDNGAGDGHPTFTDAWYEDQKTTLSPYASR